VSQETPRPDPPRPVDMPAASARPRKRVIALSILALVIVIGGVVGLLYWLHARQFEGTDDAFIDGNIVSVSPQVAGRIKEVRVVDNQDVPAGAVIATIDDRDFVMRVKQQQAALEGATAKLKAAQANLDLMKATTEATLTQGQAGVVTAQADEQRAQAAVQQAQATVRGAQAQAQSAQADVEAAQAEATRRETDVKRYDALDPRAVSQQLKDAAKSAADAAVAQLSATQKRLLAAQAQVAQEEAKVTQAEADVAAAKSRIEQARGVLQTAQTAPQQVATSQADVSTAQAAVAQAQADLDAANLQLTYTTIVAPTAGRVTRKGVEPGQYVEIGRNLCEIVEPEVWVTANFKETQITHMHASQEVDLHVDAYPGQVFHGKIQSIQSGTGARFSLLPPENATGNYVKVVQRVPVKIVFDRDDSGKVLLAPGMSVVPSVKIAGDSGAPAPIARLNPVENTAVNR